MKKILILGFFTLIMTHGLYAEIFLNLGGAIGFDGTAYTFNQDGTFEEDVEDHLVSGGLNVQLGYIFPDALFGFCLFGTYGKSDDWTRSYYYWEYSAEEDEYIKYEKANTPQLSDYTVLHFSGMVLIPLGLGGSVRNWPPSDYIDRIYLKFGAGPSITIHMLESIDGKDTTIAFAGLAALAEAGFFLGRHVYLYGTVEGHVDFIELSNNQPLADYQYIFEIYTILGLGVLF